MSSFEWKYITTKYVIDFEWRSERCVSTLLIKLSPWLTIGINFITKLYVSLNKFRTFWKFKLWNTNSNKIAKIVDKFLALQLYIGLDNLENYEIYEEGIYKSHVFLLINLEKRPALVGDNLY